MVHRIFGLSLASAAALALGGCESQQVSPDASPQAGGAESAADDHAANHSDHQAEGQTDMDKMHAELAKLSPEDRASAEKQHFCPVSGEMLGVMGAPLKVDVDGKEVWICCASCEEPLLEKPEEYLPKLNSP